MTEADICEWADFGVGVTGATAALTGVLTRLLPSLLVPGLLLASGVTMWAEWSDALYLLGAGVTLAIVAGLVNSWVLLVEIQR